MQDMQLYGEPGSRGYQSWIHLPGTSTDVDNRGEVWIAYNGGSIILREKILLQKRGYRFKSRTDTEGFYIFIKNSASLFEPHEGMFAFAMGCA